MIDHCRFVKRADHVGSSRDRDPEYRLSESTTLRETFDLRSDQATVDRARGRGAEERQTRGRHDGDAFVSLASEFRVTAKLALDTRQQIFVTERRQAH